MAKQTITMITDDLTGAPADETVSFALDGNAYEVDLTAANSSELREFLSRYIEAGTRIGRVGSPPQLRSYRNGNRDAPVNPNRLNRDENKLIREWALAQKMDLSLRGRIPQHIIDAYHQRHLTAKALEAEATQTAPAAAKQAPKKRVTTAKFSSAKVSV